ncbi:MAG TPA: hypothetical protein VFU89_02705 [Rhabdochlamydiaceae bacterium]|nr:hypothetical protein [Rhabdochlamydiaceae bacterium]
MTGKMSCVKGNPIIGSYSDLERVIGVLLETATKTKKISQQLFTIDGTKVAIVFNPTARPSMIVAEITVSERVALVSEKKLSQPMMAKIRVIIPTKYAIEPLVMSKVNGVPIFQYLELE